MGKQTKAKGKGKGKGSHQKKKVKNRRCQGCSKSLDDDDAREYKTCVCRRVTFCSDACQANFPHVNCPGPPDITLDLNVESMKEIDAFREAWTDEFRARYEKQLDETVNMPKAYYLNSNNYSVSSRRKLSEFDYAKIADEDTTPEHQAFSYMAACRFKHQLFGGRNELGNYVSNDQERDEISVLEARALAFKYFEKAAKLGHGLSMIDLGLCYVNGVGCTINRRIGNGWFWRACLQQSVGACNILDDTALVSTEIDGFVTTLEDGLTMFMPGRTLYMVRQNLGALQIALLDVIINENYALPPFSDTAPGRHLPNRLSSARVPIIASESIRQYVEMKNRLERRGNKVELVYSRRSNITAAALHTCKVASRTIDNQLFFCPPEASNNETVTADEVFSWCTGVHDLFLSNKEPLLYSFCEHVERDNNEAQLFCLECLNDAKERLDAVSTGSIAISLNEEIPERGFATIFRGLDGKLKMETWYSYSRGEVECILALLVASDISAYCSPLFIAQDPNFFWPLIAEHGSIRSALEFVAPHRNWDEILGPKQHNLCEKYPIVPSFDDNVFIKCGNGFCFMLQPSKSNSFLKCSGCKRRSYCSEKCQETDWFTHKLECKYASKGKWSGSHLSNLEHDSKDGMERVEKFVLDLKEGDNAVVHSLKKEPHYNGIIGTIQSIRDNDRFALKLHSGIEKVISIKRGNLYGINVFCKKRRKKSRVFQCIHGIPVCAECYLDFSTVNRLSALKYAGEDMTSSASVHQVIELHFSAFEPKHVKWSSNEGWPIQCSGMEEHKKERVILKALLNANTQLSINAQVARTAYITFGARKQHDIRPLTLLQEVAKVL